MSQSAPHKLVIMNDYMTGTGNSPSEPNSAAKLNQEGKLHTLVTNVKPGHKKSYSISNVPVGGTSTLF